MSCDISVFKDCSFHSCRTIEQFPCCDTRNREAYKQQNSYQNQCDGCSDYGRIQHEPESFFELIKNFADCAAVVANKCAGEAVTSLGEAVSACGTADRSR